MALVLRGVPASPGIAVGRARIRRRVRSGPVQGQPAGPEEEMARLSSAMERTAAQLRDIVAQVAERAGQNQAGILKTQLLALEDPIFKDAVEAGVLTDGCAAEEAVERTVLALAARFHALGDQWLRERAADLRDLGERLIRNLSRAPQPGQTCDGILVAQSLTPSEVSLLDPARVPAFVTEEGTATGHAAILARALNIGAVMGVKDALASVPEGAQVIVDGTLGEVVIDPDERALAEYRSRQAHPAPAAERAAEKWLPAVTPDGFRMELAANIAGLPGLAEARAAGAESVGVVRTEFLFLGRDTMPSEEEQFQAYRELVSGMKPGRVIVRTLDAGADKELAYCRLPRGENPALGLRGIRLGLRQEEILRAQLTAIARAAAFGNVAVMLPMVSDLSEVRRAKEMLNSTGGPEVSLGIMIETPAAAVMAEDLAPEVDFFSIGTNDLVQYVLAVDRFDRHVAHLYQPFHPAVLRLIRTVAEAAHRHGKWAGVCGEMAADPRAAILFLGLGIDELSMEPRSIPAVRSLIRRVEARAAAALAEEVLTLGTAAEIEARLDGFVARTTGAEA